MSDADASDISGLLKDILGPLLEDFKYWFARSVRLLEERQLDFLDPSDRQRLLAEVKQAQAELQSAELLYNLSDNKVGVDPLLVTKWHRLLMRCAEVGYRYRQLNPNADIARPDAPPSLDSNPQ
ncbi:MAG: DUF2605 domain-containing protein [Cyanobacteria bacterium J06642_2]